MSVIKRDLVIAMGSRTSEPLMVAAEEKKKKELLPAASARQKKKNSLKKLKNCVRTSCFISLT